VKVYLAGPEVFLPDGVEIGLRKKALCAAAGMIGLYPLDHGETEPGAIWRANRALMSAADAIVANLTPFRGPSADAGTVFELGMMIGAGRRAAGYSNDVAAFEARTQRAVAAAYDPARRGFVDADGMAVEAFGLADNLMIDRALHELGSAPVLHDTRDRWRDLAGFEACLRLLQSTTSRFTSL
jgi:nucleoside 2-deoxyribosyltransferase